MQLNYWLTFIYVIVSIVDVFDLAPSVRYLIVQLVDAIHIAIFLRHTTLGLKFSQGCFSPKFRCFARVLG